MDIKITQSEKKKHVLSKKADLEILAKCKQLEQQKLLGKDKFLVKFIKTQLEADWRNPLLKVLNQLYKKYNMKGD